LAVPINVLAGTARLYVNLHVLFVSSIIYIVDLRICLIVTFNATYKVDLNS